MARYHLLRDGARGVRDSVHVAPMDVSYRWTYVTLSFSQFAELLGIDDPKRIAGIGTNHSSQMVTIFLLPEDSNADDRHTASAERQREPAATAETER